MVTRIRAALSATLLLAGSALSLSMATASAETSDDANSAPVRPAGTVSSVVVPGTAAVEPLPGAALRDIQAGAAQVGRSVEDLLATHTGIAQFNAVVTDLEQRHPDIFVRAGVAASPSERNWIMLTKALPDAELEALSKALSMAVEFITGAPASSAELAAMSAQLTDGIASSPEIFRGGGTRYDPQRQQVWLEYQLVEGLTDTSASVTDTLDAILEKVAASSADHSLAVQVVPVQVQGETALEATVAGGRPTFFPGTNALACTTGFSAIRNGNRGVVTADHCPNDAHYNNVAGVISTSPAQGGPGFGNADMQFHRTLTENGHTTSGTFRASATEPNRQVTSAVNPGMNQFICHWGEGINDVRCSNVIATDECWFYDGYGNSCGLDTVQGHISTGGDSGGPWFLGNMAHGTHAGGGENSQYVRIGRAASVLGAQIITS